MDFPCSPLSMSLLMMYHEYTTSKGTEEGMGGGENYHGKDANNGGGVGQGLILLVTFLRVMRKEILFWIRWLR